MNADRTRHIISIILSAGLVATVLLLSITVPESKITYMVAGGLLTAVSGAIAFFFRDARSH